jgi:DNA-binding GntR family transcriptional regulator
MATTKYGAIADALRTRIADGTYPVGTKLPSITDLMREFDVPGLNTVRDAQQVLVREGLLRTEQGVGAWVLAQRSPTTEIADVLERLRTARTELDRAIDYLATQAGR